MNEDNYIDIQLINENWICHVLGLWGNKTRDRTVTDEEKATVPYCTFFCFRFVSGCRNSFGALCESTASIDSMERITTWRVYMQNSHNTSFLCGAHLKFTAENAYSVVLVAGETSSEPRSLELISFA